MKRGTSPIKTKIISDFMQKLSGKKEDKVLTTSEDQSVNTSINHESKLKQGVLRQVERSSEQTTVNNGVKLKSGFQKSIDDILGFAQPITRSKNVPSKPKQQAIQLNPANIQLKQQPSTKSLSQQPISPSPVTIEPSDSILEQSARSRNSSTSMKVNNSSMKFINKSSEKFISSAKPVKVLNFDDKKSIKVNQVDENLKELDVSQKDSEIKAKFQDEIKAKIHEIENLNRQKTLFVQKVNKLEQDLNRKDKELTRRVNQINSSTLQKQVVLNFISNFTQKINTFLTQKQQNTSTQPSKPINNQSTKSLSKSIPQNKRLSSSFSSSKPLSSLQSISQDKQISLIQSINLKLLDELTKSMQRGLSRSEISKKSQELVIVFRKLINELKKDQEILINNIKTENSKVQKEFDNQKQAMNRLQKLYETEKGKNQKLFESEKSLTEQLEEINKNHNNCLNVQNQLNKELENSKVSLTKLKDQLIKKDTKIQQMQEKLKTYQKLPNQHAQQKQQMKRSYEKLLREKDQQIVSLKRNQQRQIKQKLSQSLTIKQQLQQKQDQISTLSNKITNSQSRITQLQQTITQRQSQIKLLTSQLSQFKTHIQKYEKQQEKQHYKVESKQKIIEELQLNMMIKDKKVIELEFMLSEVKKELDRVREEQKGLEVKQVKLVEVNAEMKQNLLLLESSNSYKLDQIKRWKSQYEKTQHQLLQQLKSTKHLQLTSSKHLTNLHSQLSSLQQQNLHLSQKLTHLHQSNLHLQLQLINIQTISTIQSTKQNQSNNIYKELTSIQYEKHNLLMVEKDKMWRGEIKMVEEKCLEVREEYWREKDSCERLRLDCQSKTQQNIQVTNKLKALHIGLDIIIKTINSITLQSIKHIPKPTKTLNKEHIQNIIYQQNPQFAKLIKNSRQQHKKIHQIIKSITQLSIYIQTQQQQQQNLTRANTKLIQPILAFNSEMIRSAVFETQVINLWMNKDFNSIEECIEKLDDCFMKALKERNKIQMNHFAIQQLIKSLTIDQFTENTLNIDPTIFKCLNSTSQSPQNIFPNYLEKLSTLMKKMFQKLNKLSTCQVEQKINKYEFQIKQLKEDFRRQYEEMENELNQVRNQVLEKEAQFNRILERVKFQEHQPKLRQLQERHKKLLQSIHQQYQTKYQSLSLQLNLQLSSKQKSLNSHFLTINSLQHQLTFQKKRQQKLFNQLNELKQILATETENKSRLTSQLHQTKLELYELKEYEKPKWIEKCLELENLLGKKNQMLKQAQKINTLTRLS